MLDVPAEVPEEAEEVDVDAGLFQASPTDELVELELAPAARWVAEDYPCESVTELGDGRLRIGAAHPRHQPGSAAWRCASARTSGCSRRLSWPRRSRAEAAAALALYE